MRTSVGIIQEKDYLSKPDDKPIYKGVPVWNSELEKYQLDWEIDLEMYRKYALKELDNQDLSFSLGGNDYKIKLSSQYITAMIVVEKEAEVTGSGLIELDNVTSGEKETIELDLVTVTSLKENAIIPKSKQYKLAAVSIKAASTTGEITTILEGL